MIDIGEKRVDGSGVWTSRSGDVRKDAEASFEAFTFGRSVEDIHEGAEWAISNNHHSVIVHLDGQMSSLETQLNGHELSRGPANNGEVWIAPAGSSYAAAACGRRIEYCVMSFKSDVLKRVFGLTQSFDEIVPAHGVRDTYCYHSVRELMRCLDQGDDVSVLMADTLSRTLALHIYRRFGGDSVSEPATPIEDNRFDQGVVRLLREHIYENMSEPMTLAELAEMAGVTPHMFLMAFRTEFGTTPAQYIIEQRLRRAQWLLSNTDIDITRIAMDTGFASHSHLTSTFKKRTGQTPREFRREYRSRLVD